MFPTEPIVLRSRPWPAYVALAVSLGVIFLPFRNRDHSLIYVGMGLLVFSIVLWFLVSRVRIIINDLGIAYRTVFSTIEVSWQSVSKTYIRYHQHGKSGSFDWYFESSTGNTQKFPINLLSRKSIRVIAEAVTQKCRDAEIEKRIHDMAEGAFPWYIW